MPETRLDTPTTRDERARHLRRLVEDAVQRSPADALILSGGLDTSVLAHLATQLGLRRAFTVLAAPDAPDREHAYATAQRLGLDHTVLETDLDGVLEDLPFVIGTLATFDPMEIRNSVVVARALRAARDAGVRTVMTGDAADEVLAGYSFLFDKPPAEFDASCHRMARIMRFSSLPMGNALGLDVRIPFMDPAIVAYALTLHKDDKVNVHEGQRHGKYLLRLAFPDVPNRWRRKDPIEVGSGATRLPEAFRQRTSAEDFRRAAAEVKRDDGVTIRDPEHLAYYRVFQDTFKGKPPLQRHADDPCPHCGYQLPSLESDFCVTCGHWPVVRQS